MAVAHGNDCGVAYSTHINYDIIQSCIFADREQWEVTLITLFIKRALIYVKWIIESFYEYEIERLIYLNLQRPSINYGYASTPLVQKWLNIGIIK